jgi:hypothetical protein
MTTNGTFVQDPSIPQRIRAGLRAFLDYRLVDDRDLIRVSDVLVFAVVLGVVALKYWADLGWALTLAFEAIFLTAHVVDRTLNRASRQ